MIRMKKIFLAGLILIIEVASGQTVSKKIVLAKGQILEQKSEVKVNMTFEMMGQPMENKIESEVSNLIEVKTADLTGFDISNTITKAVVNMKGMGQDVNFDSDKKEDMNGQLGEAFKDKIGKPREFTINKEGIITAVKTKIDTTDQAKGMMGVMGVTDAIEKEGNSFASLATIPSKGVKIGQSWSDSTGYGGNNKTYNTYTLKEVNKGIGVVSFTGNLIINKETESQGMTMLMDLKGTSTGEYSFDVTSGIITSRKEVSRATGTIEVGGQSVPLTIETTRDSTTGKK
jgi:hypothetical protein